MVIFWVFTICGGFTRSMVIFQKLFSQCIDESHNKIKFPSVIFHHIRLTQQFPHLVVWNIASKNVRPMNKILKRARAWRYFCSLRGPFIERALSPLSCARARKDLTSRLGAGKSSGMSETDRSGTSDEWRSVVWKRTAGNYDLERTHRFTTVYHN